MKPEIDRDTPASSCVLAGVAQRDITPPIGIQSNPWGKSLNARSVDVHLPLTASALAIKGERELFLVALDLGWLCCYECDFLRFRSRVVRELGIYVDDLLVNLSQTHKGPPICIHEANREGAELVPDYIEKVITTVIEVCKEARQNLDAANITWAYGKCDLATLRDLPIGDRDYVGYNPSSPADDTLTVARIVNLFGRQVGTLVNYACHPTTLGWECDLISPDFVGSTRRIVEAKTRAPMFFLQGACGNLAPREQYVNDPEIADRNGEILGYATLATLAKMLPPASELVFSEIIHSGADLAQWKLVEFQPSGVIKNRKVEITMAHGELLSEGQMRRSWIDVDERIVDFRIQKQLGLRVNYVHDGVVDHPVWIWQIGDAFLVAHAGEAYFQMQKELRKRHPDRVIMFLDMTNGPGYIYIPIEKAYERKAYQSWQTLLASGSFEVMIESIDKAIRDFFLGD